MFSFDLVFHVFQSNALGFWKEPPNYQDLNNHHQREEREWSPGVGLSCILREDRKGPGYDHGHDPMRGAAQRLSLGANRIREDLADIDPKSLRPARSRGK